MQNRVTDGVGLSKTFVEINLINLIYKVMETNSQDFQFKTNINCGGCISKVTPFLNEAQGIGEWSVDTENKDKVLSVSSNGITEQDIVQTIQKAGFKIEPIKK